MSEERIETLDGSIAVPRKNGELVFAAPWEGRAFGMAVGLNDAAAYQWDDFRAALIAEIAAAERHGDQSGYYEHWLAAFERLVIAKGLIAPGELATRTEEYASGIRTDDDHPHPPLRRNRAPTPRNLVRRADGQSINVFRRPGQLFVCANACCCGHTERGHDPVPEELYQSEWERRRIRNTVHLTIGGCLGPCALSNVVLLLYAGREIWFHSVAGDAQVLAIYDYIDAMIAAGGYLPPPPELAPQVFTAFDWPAPGIGDARDTPANLTASEPEILFLTDTVAARVLLDTVIAELPPDFPTVRVDRIAETTTVRAETGVVAVWLHDRTDPFTDAVERIAAQAGSCGAAIVLINAADAHDRHAELLTNLPPDVTRNVAMYLALGDPRNVEHAFYCLADYVLAPECALAIAP
jgi:nitrile hydratase accessory protein